MAKVVGKSRSHVANMMRLTNLPSAVQDAVAENRLTAGHARALINAADPMALAKQVLEEGLSVRQTEELARQAGGVATRPQMKTRTPRQPKDADTVALEKRLSDALGLGVTIDHRGEAGAVHIRYRNLDQLDDVLRRLEAGTR